MQYRIKKTSVSYYPNPVLNCNLLLFLDNADITQEGQEVYSFPMPIQLSELSGKTTEEKDQYVIDRGVELFNSEQVQIVCTEIEANLDIITPELL